MLKALLGVYFIFFLLTNAFAASDNAKFGPNIYGFQLGMSLTEAIENANNLNYPVIDLYDGRSLWHYTDHVVVFLEYNVNTRLITSFTLSQDVFNAKNIDTDQFAEFFANCWKINFSKYDYYGRDGFQILSHDKNKNYKIAIGPAYLPMDNGSLVQEIEVSEIKN